MEIPALYDLYKKSFLVDTDSRNIRQGSLFFALKGDHFNGNQFAAHALEKGASFVIIDEKEYEINEKTILVDNVLKTLQQLAHYHRKQLTIPFIGLTGSNGKTTTKELINVVLQKKYNTIATKGNLNNHIGVPLTLLSINYDHEIAIIEMGANHQKEIEFLSSICEPDFGYITNFGKAHLEGFGGVEGVIKGKSELYTYLKEHNKKAFVNPEDNIQIEKTKGIDSILFHMDDIQFTNVDPCVNLKYKNTTIHTQLIGQYNFSNIAAAITIGAYFKVSESKIKEAIENYIPQNNRSQIINTKKHNIILDAYNANPSSMKVALENFNLLKSDTKAVILGDMFELGSASTEEHQAIVDFVEAMKINKAYFIGKHFYTTTTSNLKFKDFQEFKNYLLKAPIKEESILIKGSRGMQLERVLDLMN